MKKETLSFLIERSIISPMGNLDIIVSTSAYLMDHYWPLIKSRQTFLLALTGVAGYLCQPTASMDWLRFAACG